MSFVKSLKDTLIENIGSMDSDEFEEKFNQLDDEDKWEVEESIREFANNAIGNEHWDSDE